MYCECLTPFASLLAHQKEIFDTIKVHAQQGGLCVIMGEPGTGKSVIKQAIIDHDPKRMITPAIARTLHTYSNTLQILCEAFGIEVNGRDTRREKLLIEAGWKVNHEGKMLVPIIDDAHLMDVECLRKLRWRSISWCRPCEVYCECLTPQSLNLKNPRPSLLSERQPLLAAVVCIDDR